MKSKKQFLEYTRYPELARKVLQQMHARWPEIKNDPYDFMEA